MREKPAEPTRISDVRTRLLEAALNLIRARGYAATTVDELCAAAGVSKGGFFHHFASKEALAVAAAGYWSEITGEMFAGADYHDHPDPLNRVLAYIDLREQLIDGAIEDFTCLVGTMVQEAYGASGTIRTACEASIRGHAQTLEADLGEILSRRTVAGVTARGLALHTQAVLQGAFILAKATNDPQVARDSVDHLRRYLKLLFNRANADPGKETP